MGLYLLNNTIPDDEEGTAKVQRCTCTECNEEIVLDTGHSVKINIFSAQMQSSCCHKVQACHHKGHMSKGSHEGAMGNQGL